MASYYKQIVNSLRGRYLFAAILLSLLLVVSAVFAHHYVQTADTTSANNIKQRNRVLTTTESLRHMLWDANHAMHSFILQPGEVHHKALLDRLGDAIKQSKLLSELEWIQQHGLAEDSLAMRNDFITLQEETLRLMALRENIEELFPAMVILRDEMTPQNMAFATACNLAIDEIRTEDPRFSKNPVYLKLSSIQQYWNRMITTFRGYVALLTGTFGRDNPDIVQQEKNIEILYKQVMILLDELEEMPATKQSFQTYSSLQQIRASANNWHDGYLQVKTVYGTEHWRADVPFLNNRILPHHNRILAELENIDKLLDHDSNNDFTDLNTVSTTIITTFWLLTSIALVFIVAGYFLLSRTILTPIASITSALRRESFFTHMPRIPNLSTEETRGLVDAFRELHGQVQNRQTALEHQALHDALTGLPNRVLLQDRLHQAISTARRNNTSCALFVMDLDRFKEINDTLGHHIGDRVLVEISTRLLELLRSNDTVARLGGDEFSLVLPDANKFDALAIAEKILGSLDKPISIDNHHLYLGISVGIALFPEHGGDDQVLLQRADIAMYSAKRGNSGYAVYESSQDPNSLNRLRLVNDLRTAIQENALELHYQPIINLHTRDVVGAEALLRWTHPEFGAVAPIESIQLAEQTGLIRPLTNWVLSTAVKDFAGLYASGFTTGLSINLSAWNLQDIDLFENIENILAQSLMKPERLHLEITESVMMADATRARNVLRAFENLGVHLSIDDFGTGFSSLAYLKQLPVSQLKIDKSFVLDMVEDENDAAIVHSIIELAHNLGLGVTAEGVETKENLDMLIDMGCDMVQGFYLCKPLPFEQFKIWLRKHG